MSLDINEMDYVWGQEGSRRSLRFGGCNIALVFMKRWRTEVPLKFEKLYLIPKKGRGSQRLSPRPGVVQSLPISICTRRLSLYHLNLYQRLSLYFPIESLKSIF